MFKCIAHSGRIVQRSGVNMGESSNPIFGELLYEFPSSSLTWQLGKASASSPVFFICKKTVFFVCKLIRGFCLFVCLRKLTFFIVLHVYLFKVWMFFLLAQWIFSFFLTRIHSFIYSLIYSKLFPKCLLYLRYAPVSKTDKKLHSKGIKIQYVKRDQTHFIQ